MLDNDIDKASAWKIASLDFGSQSRLGLKNQATPGLDRVSVPVCQWHIPTKLFTEYPFPCRDRMKLPKRYDRSPLGGPSGRGSSAII